MMENYRLLLDCKNQNRLKIESHLRFAVFPCPLLFHLCRLSKESKIFFSFFSESEDSDNEGGLGNVIRTVMRPPGHSGKAKRGHLCFDASFETGISHSFSILA